MIEDYKKYTNQIFKEAREQGRAKKILNQLRYEEIGETFEIYFHSRCVIIQYLGEPLWRYISVCF